MIDIKIIIYIYTWNFVFPDALFDRGVPVAQWQDARLPNGRFPGFDFRSAHQVIDSNARFSSDHCGLTTRVVADLVVVGPPNQQRKTYLPLEANNKTKLSLSALCKMREVNN